MNKQELIEKLKTIEGYDGSRCYIAMDDVFKLVEQLDEPQEVEIPMFVADWIDNMKCQGKTLYYGLDHTPPEEVDLWFCEDEVNRQNTFARAWLDGYEVEKEKRYFVRLKGVVDNLRLLRHNLPTNTWTIGSEEQCFNVSRAHTRKELEEAGFGDVFNSPLFEVEEVEV